MRCYQDALWPDGAVQGERGCDERWALVAPHLPDAGVLLDIGSNLGFYSIRAVQEHPGLAVVSMESDPVIAGKQARIVAANRLQRILVLESTLTAARAEEWARTCEMVDCCLLLSVVHWFDDPERVLHALSRLSRSLIVELPDVGDAGACGSEKRRLWGTDPGDWLQSVTGREVHLIGRPARHTSEVRSWLFLVDGPIDRIPTLPYFGASYLHPNGRDYRLTSEAGGTRLSVRGIERSWMAGVNIANLAALGRCLYPKTSELRASWNTARMVSPQHPDPTPHNVLWGANGFVLIDDDDLYAAISRPDKQMQKFLRMWATSGGYDGNALKRIGGSRTAQLIRRTSERLPTVVRRPLVRILRSLLSGRRA